MSKTICVYCSSSEALDPSYYQAAQELGMLMARHHCTLVYGGGRIGLMGALARSVHEHGGKIIGVIPKSLKEKELAYEACDELIVTKDLRDRKAIMEARADAFVALPGGFGTLEEVFEILTLKQLQFHLKPVILVNTNSFYDHLIRLCEHIYRERFAKTDSRLLYHVAASAANIFSHLETYQPPLLDSKWF
ncbi:TIGR00730 family Rossman fold protein [candidate division KSB1 bacterium]|nr:TIGR00730 family Rossman fold protein [candidate division KSB1 bacterium]